MLKIFNIFLSMCLSVACLVEGSEEMRQDFEEQMTPQYLYKVLSVEDWRDSQGRGSVKLQDADREFIHLSRADQINRIVEKYWNNVPEYVILKIDTAKMEGTLVFEANPGGNNKYYHLYHGSIPLSAVIESKTITR